jgi:NAD-dependent dihydropyrimidine dehydrogenase PreA subunit
MWKVTVDKDKCTGDGECADVCPVDVYQLIEGRAEHFDAITVEEV